MTAKRLANVTRETAAPSHRSHPVGGSAAPKSWGKDESKKHNAMFTLRTTTPARVLQAAPPREEVDEVSTGPGVIFWSVSTKLFGRSSINKFGASSAYRDVTVRNHNTVVKLLGLLDQL